MTDDEEYISLLENKITQFYVHISNVVLEVEQELINNPSDKDEKRLLNKRFYYLDIVEEFEKLFGQHMFRGEDE